MTAEQGHTWISWLYIALANLQFYHLYFKWVSKTHISEETFDAHVSLRLGKGIYDSMYSYSCSFLYGVLRIARLLVPYLVVGATQFQFINTSTGLVLNTIS